MKVALVTGASRGIGQAISLQLKEDGYRVLGTATTSSGIKSLKDKGIEGLELDLNSPNSKETFWQEIESKEVNISILVNNAGITRDNIVLRMSDNEWQDSTLFLLSAWRQVREGLGRLARRRRRQSMPRRSC